MIIIGVKKPNMNPVKVVAHRQNPVLNLDRLMDLAKAMAVPRDTRMEAVPREALIPRAIRAVEEDPARREDPIRELTRVLDPNLDRTTVPVLAKEVVMVPRDPVKDLPEKEVARAPMITTLR